MFDEISWGISIQSTKMVPCLVRTFNEILRAKERLYFRQISGYKSLNVLFHFTVQSETAREQLGWFNDIQVFTSRIQHRQNSSVYKSREHREHPAHRSFLAVFSEIVAPTNAGVNEVSLDLVFLPSARASNHRMGHRQPSSIRESEDTRQEFLPHPSIPVTYFTGMITKKEQKAGSPDSFARHEVSYAVLPSVRALHEKILSGPQGLPETRTHTLISIPWC